jgi:hypothetical protein
MGTAALVEAEISAGQELLKLLDAKRFAVQSAAWIYFPEQEEWKFLIATPKAESDLQRAYLELITILRTDPVLERTLDLSRLRIVRESDPILNALSQLFHVDEHATLRSAHNAINGIYIDDALIYRLAA